VPSPSPPPARVASGPLCARVPTASPSPNARERYITIRFDAGKRTQLPVTPEAIHIRINQTLRNLGKVSHKIPYIWEAALSLKLAAFT